MGQSFHTRDLCKFLECSHSSLLSVCLIDDNNLCAAFPCDRSAQVSAAWSCARATYYFAVLFQFGSSLGSKPCFGFRCTDTYRTGSALASHSNRTLSCSGCTYQVGHMYDKRQGVRPRTQSLDSTRNTMILLDLNSPLQYF